MSHSHLPVRHLIKQVELNRSKRSNRDVRPDWVTAFIERVAELFEPISDDGRVGFESNLAEGCWTVRMYLGTTELVGGKEDGLSRHADFEFDALQLGECFTHIDRFRWLASPEASAGNDSTDSSCLLVDGRVGDECIRLRIRSVAPASAGPGFRQYPNGRRDTV